MMARGYTGEMPVLEERETPVASWLAVLAGPMVAAVVAVIAVVGS